jgi:SAM-dependent methyltransferase
MKEVLSHQYFTKIRNTTPMSDELIRHYTDARDEDSRLRDGIGPFEYERTTSLIGDYLGREKLTIVDAGGGTGAYALWLAGQGHEVHVIDLVPRHIDSVKDKARARSLELGSARVGDARSLPFDDSFADLVLLMGPLYHLTEEQDRLLALRESARVVKDEGHVLCTAISRFASMLAGFRFKRFDDPHFEAMVDRDLMDGQHRNPVEGSQHLTTAYLHRPRSAAGNRTLGPAMREDRRHREPARVASTDGGLARREGSNV